MQLRDPETCPNGHGRKSCNVIDSRVHAASETRPGYRRRRHRCNICGETWTSYQSLINPLYVRVRHKHIVSDVQPT